VASPAAVTHRSYWPQSPKPADADVSLHQARPLVYGLGWAGLLGVLRMLDVRFPRDIREALLADLLQKIRANLNLTLIESQKIRHCSSRAASVVHWFTLAPC
jgi:hypothetical protein